MATNDANSENGFTVNGFGKETLDMKASFIQELADACGQQLKTYHIMRKRNSVQVRFAIGNIPFAAFGVHGKGPCLKFAHADAAIHLLMLLERYLPVESIPLLLCRWSEAHEQIIQIVQVFREFDNFLNMDRYASLRELEPFTCSLMERALRKEFLTSVQEYIFPGSSNITTSRKRALSVDGATEPQQAKRSANGLSDELCLDETPSTIATPDSMSSILQPSDDNHTSFQYEDDLRDVDQQHQVSSTSMTNAATTTDHSVLDANVVCSDSAAGDMKDNYESSEISRSRIANQVLLYNELNSLHRLDPIKIRKSKFVQEVATAWGHPLTISHHSIHHPKAEVQVMFDFADIPYIVLGISGTGSCVESAHGDAAANLLSFMENNRYLSKKSIELLRSRWSDATEQMAELVQVLRELDSFVNMDKYSSLRTSNRREFSAGEMSLAQLVRKRFREYINTMMIDGISQPPKDMESKYVKFVQEVATAWGKELKMSSMSSRVLAQGKDCAQVEVLFTFGDIPGVVLPVKGIAPCLEAARDDAARQLLNTLKDGFLPKESIDVLFSRWSDATVQMAEIIRVLQMFDDFLNMDEYASLRLVDGFVYTKEEKVLATRMKRAIKKLIAAEIAHNSIDISSIDVVNPSLEKYHCSQQEDTLNYITYAARTCEQSALGEMVRSVVAASDIVEFDANRLNDWHALTKKKAFGGHATLSDWCQLNNIPLDYERVLLGVEYCGSPSLDETVQEYLLEYKDQCRRVDNEIWNHFHTNAQNSEVYALKMQAREMLLHHFKPAFPYSDIKMYAVGSTMNGCGSFNSDMDLCLCVPDLGTMDKYTVHRSEANQTMFKLRYMMSTKLQHLVKEAKVIASAKVPIIQTVLHAPFENLELDININNIAGIYNSHLIHYYSGLDGRFPCLSLLVKHWAINAKINNAQAGTFNSYSLVLLVVHYLQCGVQPAVLPNLQYLFPEKFVDMPPVGQLELHKNIEGLPLRPVNIASCVELLIGFFKYYSNFDFGEYFISIRDARKALRRDLSIPTKCMIYIEEPFDRNNTARCVIKQNNLDLIKQAFHSARRAFSDGPPDLARIGVQVVNV